MATSKPVDHEPVYPWLFWVAGALYLGIGSLIVLGAPSDLKVLVGITFAAFTVTLIQERESDRIWLYRFFGYNMLVFMGGLIVEFPGMRVKSYPKARRQRQFPEEPENVYKGDDKDALPPRTDGRGYKMRAFRVVTGGPSPDYSGHLNQQMTVTMTGTVRYHINPKYAFDFDIRIPGATDEEKFAEAERQMYDTWGKTVLRECESRPAGLIAKEGEKIRNDLFTDLCAELEHVALVADEVNLESPDLGHELSDILQQPSKASATGAANRTLFESEGYGLKVKGEGQAAADLASAKAVADGVAYQAEVLDKSPTALKVFTIDKAAATVTKGDKFVLGVDSLMAAVKGFQGGDTSTNTETTGA